MNLPRTGFLAALLVAAALAALVAGIGIGLALGEAADEGTSAPLSPTSTTTTTTEVSAPNLQFPTPDTVGVPSDLVLLPADAYELDVDGATIDGRHFDGPVIVTADNVTITRSRIEGNRRLVVECDGCRNLTLDQVDIIGTGDSTQGCIGRSNFTLTRSFVSGCIDGVKANSNVLLRGNWIGNLRRIEADPQQGGGSSHNDGVQGTGGDNVRVIGNTIVHATGGQTSPMKLSADRNPLTNVEVRGNLLSSSTCRALYVNVQSDDGRWPNPTGVVADNVIRGATCTSWLVTSGPGLEISGNVVQGP